MSILDEIKQKMHNDRLKDLYPKDTIKPKIITAEPLGNVMMSEQPSITLGQLAAILAAKEALKIESLGGGLDTFDSIDDLRRKKMLEQLRLKQWMS